MERILETMLRLPLDVLISSMEAMTRTMQEIQRKAYSQGETSRVGETNGENHDGTPPMFGNVMRLALTPLFEMYKVPANGLASGLETISNAMDELRRGPAATNGASVEEVRSVSNEVVLLDDTEAAMERRAWLAAGLEEAAGGALWQIGRPGGIEHAARWTATFDYTVGTDVDPVNKPRMPHRLTVEGGPKSDGGTETLNVLFALDRDYGPGELALIYDRWGAEKDQVSVDDQLLAPVQGAGRGKLRHVALSLGGISRGNHVITITASGVTTENEHRIDCVSLAEVDASVATH